MEDKLINIKSGELVGVDDDDTRISEALKAVKLEIKKYQEIEAALLSVVKDRIREGDKTYADFWTVQFREPSINETEDSKLLSPTDKKAFKGMKKAFDAYKKKIFQPILEKKKKTIVIGFPKY